MVINGYKKLNQLTKQKKIRESKVKNINKTKF